MNCVKNGGNLVMIEQNHTVIVPSLICQSFQWEYKKLKHRKVKIFVIVV